MKLKHMLPGKNDTKSKKHKNTHVYMPGFPPAGINMYNHYFKRIAIKQLHYHKSTTAPHVLG